MTENAELMFGIYSALAILVLPGVVTGAWWWWEDRRQRARRDRIRGAEERRVPPFREAA